MKKERKKQTSAYATTAQIHDILEQIKHPFTVHPISRAVRWYDDGSTQVVIRLSVRNPDANALVLRSSCETQAQDIALNIASVTGMYWRGIMTSTYFNKDGPTCIELIFKDSTQPT